jgi:hypothetical protein
MWLHEKKISGINLTDPKFLKYLKELKTFSGAEAKLILKFEHQPQILIIIIINNIIIIIKDMYFDQNIV